MAQLPDLPLSHLPSLGACSLLTPKLALGSALVTRGRGPAGRGELGLEAARCRAVEGGHGCEAGVGVGAGRQKDSKSFCPVSRKRQQLAASVPEDMGPVGEMGHWELSQPGPPSHLRARASSPRHTLPHLLLP